LLGIPAFGRNSFHAFARNGGVKFDHWFAALDQRIRAAGDNASGFCEKSALSLDGLAKF